MSNSKEKRKAFRVPLMAEACAWVNGEDTESSQVVDISIEGAFIKSIKQPPAGALIEFKMALPSDLGFISLEGKVVWKRWAVTKKNQLPIGFGITFINLTDKPGVVKVLDAFVNYMRNKQIIIVSKKIIEEFFNDKGPVA